MTTPPPRSKWRLLARYWLLQAAVVWAAAVGWEASAGWVGSAARRFPVFQGGDILGLVLDPEFEVSMALFLGLFTVLQGLLLLPVRRPAPTRERGWPLWISLTTAGGLIATLIGAGLLAAYSCYTLFVAPLPYQDAARWVLAFAVLLSWGVATPLLLAFSRGKRRETFLARLAARVLLGTVIEAAAIIPFDVMVRRRDTCYCFAGTYIALTVCGSIGLLVLGPAIFLPLLAKRRKRWYGGRCDACGYDMAGLGTAAACPECGAGWRATPEAAGAAA